MRMKLSFSSIEILKKLLLSLILFVLAGCSTYQPPAPIYGAPSATNPYQSNNNKSIGTSDNEFKRQTKVREIDKPELPVGEEQKSKSSVVINNEPAFIRKPLSAASIALITDADNHTRAGDLDSAVATIERALRIDSRNPTLTYKLAQLRLKQSKPRLAEDLAKKAALLSASDTTLKKQSWLLISEARKQQKNYYGAKEAKLKADAI